MYQQVAPIEIDVKTTTTTTTKTTATTQTYLQSTNNHNLYPHIELCSYRVTQILPVDHGS